MGRERGKGRSVIEGEVVILHSRGHHIQGVEKFIIIAFLHIEEADFTGGRLGGGSGVWLYLE